MIFEYLKVKNYRPYYGEQYIFFRNQNKNPNYVHKKNIILIGGLNGHGKTSIINAINIALFGHRFFKNKYEYGKYLMKSVNNKFVAEGGKEGSIELAFSEDSGKYAIEVAFIHKHSDEFRNVYELNDQLEKVRKISLNQNEFIEFIDSRIPLDVAQFFIFDAEKIREIVGDQDKEDTKRAIQKVVSLELYNQLHKDLDKIHMDFLKEIQGKATSKEIYDIFQKIESLSNDIDRFEKEMNELKERIRVLNNERINTEQERRKKLAQASMTKSTLSQAIGENSAKLKDIENSLFEFKSNDLYEVIILPAIKSLKERLYKEKQYLDALEREKIKFAPYQEFINELLNIDLSPELTEEQKSQLKEKGKAIWAKINNIKQKIIEEKLEILHDLSHSDYQKIINYPEIRPKNIQKLLEEKEQTERLIQKYKNQLDDAPEHIDTSELDEKLRKINQELGELIGNKKSLLRKINHLTDTKSKIMISYNEKVKDLNKIDSLQRKVDLSQRLKQVTKEFIEKVTVLKAKQLKGEIEKILGQLFRKSDFSNILFDENSFTLTIFNEYGNKIDLNTRSEGEKQLIALAMIWALTKVSGSNFPFVIDTPLARLDSVHRRNLVDHFFTKLSDQVIILSTDTEITNDFYQELLPFIETEYILYFDEEQNYSKIERGYFFEREEAVWRP